MGEYLDLLNAMFFVESFDNGQPFNHFARKDAKGGGRSIAGVTDSTWAELKKKGKLPSNAKRFDPEMESLAGIEYFKWILDRPYIDGDARKAVAAYHMGPTALNRLQKKYGAKWESHLPADTKTHMENTYSALNQNNSFKQKYNLKSLPTYSPLIAAMFKHQDNEKVRKMQTGGVVQGDPKKGGKIYVFGYEPDETTHLQSLQRADEDYRDFIQALDSRDFSSTPNIDDGLVEVIYQGLYNASGDDVAREKLRPFIDGGDANVKELFSSLNEREYKSVSDRLKEVHGHIQRELSDYENAPDVREGPDLTFRHEFERAGKEALSRMYKDVEYIGASNSEDFLSKLGKVPEGSDIMFMDHSGDRMFGMPSKEFFEALKSRNPKVCIGGTCGGKELFKEEINGFNKIYLTDKKWTGFDLSKKGMDSIMPTGYKKGGKVKTHKGVYKASGGQYIDPSTLGTFKGSMMDKSGNRYTTDASGNLEALDVGNPNMLPNIGSALGMVGSGVTTYNMSNKNPSVATGAIGGAMQGAGALSSFGPWGMAAGAVIGGAAGAIGGLSRMGQIAEEEARQKEAMMKNKSMSPDKGIPFLQNGGPLGQDEGVIGAGGRVRLDPNLKLTDIYKTDMPNYRNAVFRQYIEGTRPHQEYVRGLLRSHGKFRGEVYPQKGLEKMQNGGPVEMVDIQTEKGEMILLPDLSLHKVAATKPHSKMGDDEVTDIAPVGSYVFSDKTKLDRDMAEEIELGESLVVYKEGEKPEPPMSVTMAQFFSKKKNTPAQVAKNIDKTYKTADKEDNILAERTKMEHKISKAIRLPILAMMSEEVRQQEEMMSMVPQFGNGGFVIPKFEKGGSVSKKDRPDYANYEIDQSYHPDGSLRMQTVYDENGRDVYTIWGEKTVDGSMVWKVSFSGERADDYHILRELPPEGLENTVLEFDKKSGGRPIKAHRVLEDGKIQTTKYRKDGSIQYVDTELPDGKREIVSVTESGKIDFKEMRDENGKRIGYTNNQGDDHGYYKDQKIKELKIEEVEKLPPTGTAKSIESSVSQEIEPIEETKVGKYTRKVGTIFDTIEEVDVKVVQLFDDEGNLVEKKIYEPHSEKAYTAYDGDGYRVYDEEGALTQRGVRDENGKIIAKVYYLPNGMEVNGDNISKIEIVNPDGEGRIYDSFGQSPTGKRVRGKMTYEDPATEEERKIINRIREEEGLNPVDENGQPIDPEGPYTEGDPISEEEIQRRREGANAGTGTNENPTDPPTGGTETNPDAEGGTGTDAGQGEEIEMSPDAGGDVAPDQSEPKEIEMAPDTEGGADAGQQGGQNAGGGTDQQEGQNTQGGNSAQGQQGQNPPAQTTSPNQNEATTSTQANQGQQGTESYLQKIQDTNEAQYYDYLARSNRLSSSLFGAAGMDFLQRSFFNLAQDPTETPFLEEANYMDRRFEAPPRSLYESQINQINAPMNTNARILQQAGTSPRDLAALMSLQNAQRLAAINQAGQTQALQELDLSRQKYNEYNRVANANQERIVRSRNDERTNKNRIKAGQADIGSGFLQNMGNLMTNDFLRDTGIKSQYLQNMLALERVNRGIGTGANTGSSNTNMPVEKINYSVPANRIVPIPDRLPSLPFRPLKPMNPDSPMKDAFPDLNPENFIDYPINLPDVSNIG